MFTAAYVINIIVIAVLVVLVLGLVGDDFFLCTVDRLRKFYPKRAA